MSKIRFTFENVNTGETRVCKTIPNYQRVWDEMRANDADLQYIRRREADGLVYVDIGYRQVEQ